MRFSLWFSIVRLVSAVLALTACNCAAAHTFCATTAQELQDALAASSFNGAYASEINIVHVAAGTYMTSGSNPFLYDTMGGAALFLSGGYNADCTVLTPKAALTVLDGRGQTPVLRIFGGSALIVVAELTIQNGESDESGAGLRINDYELPIYNYGTVSLSDLIIRNNHTTSQEAGLFAASGTGGQYFPGAQSQFILEDCLFEGNSSANVAAGLIYTTSATVLVFNNTISGNTVPEAAGNAYGGLQLSSSHTAQASNNIFWNNTHADFVFTAGALLLSNDYGVISGTPLTSNNNVSVDPQFVDAAGGDFHLASSSPLITFSALLEGVDLDGNPHPTSGREDIGAYLETIFGSGFELEP